MRKEREESQWEEKIFITEKDCVEKINNENRIKEKERFYKNLTANIAYILLNTNNGTLNVTKKLSAYLYDISCTWNSPKCSDERKKKFFKTMVLEQSNEVAIKANVTSIKKTTHCGEWEQKVLCKISDYEKGVVKNNLFR